MSAGIIHHELLYELSYGKDILVVGSICVWISFSLVVMLCIFDIEPTIPHMQKKKETLTRNLIDDIALSQTFSKSESVFVQHHMIF